MEKSEENKKHSSSETSIEDFYAEQSTLLNPEPISSSIGTSPFLHTAALQHIYLDVLTPPPNQTSI